MAGRKGKSEKSLEGLPNLFTYEDYRLFLKDVCDHLKNSQSDFSFRKFAKKAGFSSSHYITMVINKERSLTPKSIAKCAAGLDLNKTETEFFESLVLFTQAKNSKQKNFHYEKLKKIRGYKEVKPIEREEFEFFMKWYYTAVREIVALDDFKENTKWISQRVRPSIKEAQAKQAIDLLLDIKFLTRDASGKLIQADPTLATSPELRSLALKNLQRQMLSRASHSLDDVAPELRDITSLTVGVDPAQMPEMKKRILDFRRSFLKEFASANPNPKEAYQLAIQFFPLSQPAEKDRGEKS